MRKPLQVGDRVRIYAHYGPYTGTVIEIDVSASNRYRNARGLVRIKSDIGEEWTHHPRQCVRLRRKKKSEKTVSIGRESLAEAWASVFSTPADVDGSAFPIFLHKLLLLEIKRGNKK